MDLVAEKFAKLSPSLPLSITSQAEQMIAEGQEIYSFSTSEPDLDTPDFIKDAAVEALRAGQTKYTATTGITPLKEAILEKLLLENNIECHISQISVNCGARHSCAQAIMACCGPGDEVIIPSPYRNSYPAMVKMAGAEPYFVKTEKENGWKLSAETFEESIGGRTRMLILNNPGDPTGAVYSREELAAIAEVALSEDVIILADEIYEKLVYHEREHVSIASLGNEIRDLTITVNGFSKAYCMTGWRIGYTAAPRSVAKALAAIQSHTTSHATTFAQYGALAALKGDQSVVNDMVEEYDMRRQYMMSRLRKIKNIGVIEPEGAFYFLVDTTDLGLNSVNLTEKLLSRYQVATVPGTAFGNDHSIRFSYATGLDVIKKGLDRFESFCVAH